MRSKNVNLCLIWKENGRNFKYPSKKMINFNWLINSHLQKLQKLFHYPTAIILALWWNLAFPFITCWSHCSVAHSFVLGDLIFLFLALLPPYDKFTFTTIHFYSHTFCPHSKGVAPKACLMVRVLLVTMLPF